MLVAGIGNIFLADDGVGCQVVRHLEDLAALPGVRVVDYGIRGMHLTYDLLDGWDLVVLVDALPDRGDVGRVEVLKIEGVSGTGSLDAHGMEPTAVLSSVVALGGDFPSTYLVGVQVRDVSERIGLSDLVTDAVVPAAGAVRGLVTEHLAMGRRHAERVG